MRFLVILVSIVFILFTVGCENNAETQQTANVAEQQSDLSTLSDEQESNTAVQNKNRQQSGQIDTSLYYFRKYNPEKEFKKDRITWKEDDITFIAHQTESEEKHTSNTVISSIAMEKGNKKYVIKLDEKPIQVSSLALSAGDEYLAVNVSYHYGDKVIIINLTSGEHFILNEYLESNGQGFIETIHSYHWSPDGNKLAFSFGDTSESRLGIYDLDHKAFSLIPTEINYITTSRILWHKDEKGLDFISEYPSDRFKLYRYYFDRSHVEKIRDLNRDDFVPKLQKLFESTRLF